MLIIEAINTNFIVVGATQCGLELTIYRTRACIRQPIAAPNQQQVDEIRRWWSVQRQHFLGYLVISHFNGRNLNVGLYGNPVQTLYIDATSFQQIPSLFRLLRIFAHNSHCISHLSIGSLFNQYIISSYIEVS